MRCWRITRRHFINVDIISQEGKKSGSMRAKWSKLFELSLYSFNLVSSSARCSACSRFFKIFLYNSLALSDFWSSSSISFLLRSSSKYFNGTKRGLNCKINKKIWKKTGFSIYLNCWHAIGNFQFQVKIMVDNIFWQKWYNRWINFGTIENQYQTTDVFKKAEIENEVWIKSLWNVRNLHWGSSISCSGMSRNGCIFNTYEIKTETNFAWFRPKFWKHFHIDGLSVWYFFKLLNSACMHLLSPLFVANLQFERRSRSASRTSNDPSLNNVIFLYHW